MLDQLQEILKTILLQFFVPVLHSNTSSLEAQFSLVCSTKKDTCCDYIAAVSTFYAGVGVEALHDSRNKSYSEKDIIVVLEDKNGVTAIEMTLGRNDSWHQKTVKDIISMINKTKMLVMNYSHGHHFGKPGSPV